LSCSPQASSTSKMNLELLAAGKQYK